VDSQSGSRALGAANDLLELLRLAEASAERVAQEVYGVAYEHAELIEREVRRLRRSADKLKATLEEYIAREETATMQRGHPLRRASDHRPN
jgi:hypothetical protein